MRMGEGNLGRRFLLEFALALLPNRLPDDVSDGPVAPMGQFFCYGPLGALKVDGESNPVLNGLHE